MLADMVLIASLPPAAVVGLTIYGEARGASDALRAGVASAIANRVKAQRRTWGLTAADVCRKPMQFSCWSPIGGAANYDVVIAAAQLIASGKPIDDTRLKACLALGAEVCAGVLVDSVYGAVSYFSPRSMIPVGRVPTWAIGLTPVAIVDGTRFYSGVK